MMPNRPSPLRVHDAQQEGLLCSLPLALLLSRGEYGIAFLPLGTCGPSGELRSPEILPLRPTPAWPGRRGVLTTGALPPAPAPGQGAWVLPGKQPPRPAPLYRHRSGERTSCHSHRAVSPCPGGWAAGGPLGRLQVWEEGNEERGAWEWGTVAKKTFLFSG